MGIVINSTNDQTPKQLPRKTDAFRAHAGCTTLENYPMDVIKMRRTNEILMLPLI